MLAALIAVEMHFFARLSKVLRARSEPPSPQRFEKVASDGEIQEILVHCGRLMEQSDTKDTLDASTVVISDAKVVSAGQCHDGGVESSSISPRRLLRL
jgi:hypothetical protein